MSFILEKLEVYPRAVDFSENISALLESFLRGKYYLADQLNRAALSSPTRCQHHPNLSRTGNVL